VTKCETYFNTAPTYTPTGEIIYLIGAEDDQYYQLPELTTTNNDNCNYTNYLKIWISAPNGTNQRDLPIFMQH
jgi:hypothetical protein